MDQETIDIYDANAAKFLEMVESSVDDDCLAAFIETLPKGAQVLDLGCGPGTSAAKMRDLGMAVTAIDASAEMAALARKKYDLDVMVATFDDIDGEDIYDGIWASFSLLHAPRVDMPRYLSALKLALKPGSILVIGLKIGTGEARDKLGRSYTYYQQDELYMMLTNAGLTPSDTTLGQDAGLSGEIAPWMVVTAHG